MLRINKKIIATFSIIAFMASFVLLAFFILKNNSNTADIKAAGGDNIAGYAWNKNIGWISFNSDNCDVDKNSFIDEVCGGDNATTPIQNYGVNLDFDTGNLSGYAWSEIVGWISFEANDVIGCPSGICNPRYDSETNELLGWARTTVNGDGWDGWISLNCSNGEVCAISDYKISLSGDNLIGYAWGGDVIGWISFNSDNCDVDENGFIDEVCGGDNATTPIQNYGVYFKYFINIPPTVTANPVSPINYCVSDLPGGVTLSWDFNDTEDGTVQTAYEIELIRSDAVTCIPDKQTSSATSLVGTDINSFCVNFIDYGEYTYIWKIKVYDSANADSEFVDGASFPPSPTPIHRYPKANFSYSADDDPPLQFQEIAFDPLDPLANSVCYNNSNEPTPCLSFEWSFGDGTAPNPTSDPLIDGGVVTHLYSTEGNFIVDLQVTDFTSPTAFSCWASQRNNGETIPIGANVPDWNETTP